MDLVHGIIRTLFGGAKHELVAFCNQCNGPIYAVKKFKEPVGPHVFHLDGCPFSSNEYSGISALNFYGVFNGLPFYNEETMRVENTDADDL